MLLLTIRKRKLISSLLVFVHFGLLILLTELAAMKVSHRIMPVEALMTAGVSVALAAWTLFYNQPGNFNISPLPKDWGVLVTTGPYRWVRHPMYTSVLLGAAALTLISGSSSGWVIWSALAIVLFVKSILKERWMREQRPGYRTYIRESKRFLPWVF